MNEELIAIVLGAILPPVIDLVNKYVPNSNGRYLVSLLFSLVVGGLIAVFEFGWEEALTNAGLIFASAQTVYKLWYEGSGIQNRVRG